MQIKIERPVFSPIAALKLQMIINQAMKASCLAEALVQIESIMINKYITEFIVGGAGSHIWVSFPNGDRVLLITEGAEAEKPKEPDFLWAVDDGFDIFMGISALGIAVAYGKYSRVYKGWFCQCGFNVDHPEYNFLKVSSSILKQFKNRK